MLLQAVGAALPAAVAVALSPFPVIGIVLVLTGPRGRVNGPLFAVGWLIGLTAVVVLAAVVLGDAVDPDSVVAAIADWGRVVAGAAFVVLGFRKWRSRPRRGETAPPPAWMASIHELAPARALVLGLGLAGANPKNIVLAGAAASSIVEAGVEGGEQAIALVAFVLVGSVSVIAAVATELLGGDRGAGALERVREFMTANSAVITMVILVLLGASLIGDGLSGLGRSPR